MPRGHDVTGARVSGTGGGGARVSPSPQSTAGDPPDSTRRSRRRNRCRRRRRRSRYVGESAAPRAHGRIAYRPPVRVESDARGRPVAHRIPSA